MNTATLIAISLLIGGVVSQVIITDPTTEYLSKPRCNSCYTGDTMTRKDLLESTVKKLFALSGNMCAFPTCTQKMVEHGDVIGVICHIEAAEKGGQRYNPDQTDDERRDFSNLVLLCPTHHTITNNVAIYSVDKLKEIKAIHEAKYVDTPFDVSDEIVSRAIKSYVSMQSIHNLTAATQNITQSGDIYNTGIGVRDVLDLIEVNIQKGLLSQDSIISAVKEMETKHEQLKHDLDKIYTDSQAGIDVKVELSDVQRQISQLSSADDKFMDLFHNSIEIMRDGFNGIFSLITRLNEVDRDLADAGKGFVKVDDLLIDTDRSLSKQITLTRLQITCAFSVMSLSWALFKSLDISFGAGIITIAIWEAIDSIQRAVKKYYLRRRKQKGNK